MCDICKDLINCPEGSRREVAINNFKYSTFTDHYGREITVDGPVMAVDKHSTGTTCFIRETLIDENSVQYDFRLDGVKFCPFCGDSIVPIPTTIPKLNISWDLRDVSGLLED